MNLNELKIWLEKEYDLGSDIQVELLRSYTNDVYLVKTSSEKYVLKIYGQEWRTEAEISWELELLEYLKSKDVPVSDSIPSLNRNKVLKFSDHYAVLFDYAPGKKPVPPFTPELYKKFGQVAAQFHEQSQGFSSSYFRPAVDLVYLIDNSIPLYRNLVSDEGFELVTKLGQKLKLRIEELKEKGLDYGPVHGDLTLDNLHITPDGKITLYDFDSSGLGFRAMELQGWVVLNPDLKPNVDAYLEGYKEVRNISDNDLRAAPYLQAAQDIWLRKGMKALSTPELMKFKIQKVKEWLDYFKALNQK